MQEHKSLVPILHVVKVVHTVLLLPFPARVVNGHCDRWLAPAMPQHEGFQVKWDSVIHVRFWTETKGIGMFYFVISNIIVHAHALYLHRTEHPTNIVDNFYIS
jgi:hypothetical protein